MEADQKQILDRNLEWYKNVLADIREERNLHERLKEVDSFIDEVDKKETWDTKTKDGLKNEIFYLKYSILELI